MAPTDLNIPSSTMINNNPPLEVAPCDITQRLQKDFPEGIPTSMEVRKHFFSVSDRDLNLILNVEGYKMPLLKKPL